MNTLWNKKNLDRPANNIWEASSNEIELASFFVTLDKVIKDLEYQDALHMEAAILSRLIYRMKSKFRNDKGLKNMEKVNRALLNYLALDLSKEYQRLRSYAETERDSLRLPTKQMLEYVLVRTQGFAKLMCRIEDVAKRAGEFFQARLSMGQAWTVSVIAYAVVSRIWFLSRCLLKKCCSWYNRMYPHLNRFKQVGPAWLPPGYHFPENLKTWLHLPWIDHVTDNVPLSDDGKQTIFDLIKAEDDILNDSNYDDLEIIECTTPDTTESNVRNESRTKKDFLKTDDDVTILKHETVIDVEDLGKSIDRREFETKLQREKLTRRKKKLKNKAKTEDILVPVAASNTIRKRPVVLEVQERTNTKHKRKRIESEVSSIQNLSTSVNAQPMSRKKKKLKSGEKASSSDRLESTEKLGGMTSPKLDESISEAPKSDIAASSPKKKLKRSVSNDLKSKNDVQQFLSADSHPALDKLQWNMLTNAVKNDLRKLAKCDGSDKNRETRILEKINRKIKVWIH